MVQMERHERGVCDRISGGQGDVNSSEDLVGARMVIGGDAKDQARDLRVVGHQSSHARQVLQVSLTVSVGAVSLAGDAGIHLLL